MRKSWQTPTPAEPQSDQTTQTGSLWTADDVARYVGCSVRQICNFRYAGMPTIKFRHLIRFEQEVVKCWLREQNG